MSTVWNSATYDSERRRLIYCFDEFYGTAGELVARFCPDSPSILDLGAGTGILSAAIVERAPTAKLHLLDASSEMLLQAASSLGKWQPQITVQSLIEALPEGPFDAIVSALAIHHLNDAEKQDLYSRILAALAPGGAIQRMSHDQCADVSEQVAWLDEIGFEDAECLFRSFRFAVFCGWKPIS